MCVSVFVRSSSKVKSLMSKVARLVCCKLVQLALEFDRDLILARCNARYNAAFGGVVTQLPFGELIHAIGIIGMGSSYIR